MELNKLPKYDMSDNPTNCCPRFKPESWDQQELHFKNKRFLKAKTISFLHIPLNMGSMYPKTFAAIEKADAFDPDNFIVLSYDLSAWQGEHYFSVTKDVPEQEMVHLSGDYLTKVFEGPYKNAPKWEKEMQDFVKTKDTEIEKIYFFYTTCPKCSKFYGKNYVVAVAKIT